LASNTRNVALGSSSLTVPSNSSNSSLAIIPRFKRLSGAGDRTEMGENQVETGVFGVD
jgi:hypothetical protein